MVELDEEPLAVSEWEVKLALALAELSYVDFDEQTFTVSRAYEDLKGDFSIDGEIGRFCTSGGQHYLLCVAKYGGARHLFCAFRGSSTIHDWPTNLDVELHVSDDEHRSCAISSPVHSGFHKRMLLVPLEGILRLAVDYEVSRLVVCGHSLGGAVSHLFAARLLMNLGLPQAKNRFSTSSIRSIAFGAPFVGGSGFVNDMNQQAWSECFTTLVNGQDPVPVGLNMAQTLLGGFTKVASDFARNLLDGGESPAASGTNLIEEAVAATAAGEQQSMVYYPLGVYIFMDTQHGTNVTKKRSEIMQRLGSVRIFEMNTSMFPTFFAPNKVSDHQIRKYRESFDRMRELSRTVRFERRSGQDTHLSNPFRTETLFPVVSNVMCEIGCNTADESDNTMKRFFALEGQNLDFVDLNVIIDATGVDPDWSTKPVLTMRIIRWDRDKLVLQQDIDKHKSPKSPNGKSHRVPNSNLKIQLKSQVWDARTLSMELERTKVWTTAALEESGTSYYGWHFFVDMQQSAWILRQFFGDSGLSNKLKSLSLDLLPERQQQKKKYLTIFDSIEKACTFEALRAELEKDTHREVLTEIYERSVEPMLIQTKKQRDLQIVTCAAAIVIGGGIVASGGLALVGPLIGATGSLTGGYGTASLVVGTASTASHFLFRSGIGSGYRYLIFLQDTKRYFLEGNSFAPVENELEERICDLYLNLEANDKFMELKESVQNQVRVRMAMVRYIHELKVERARLRIAVVVGPRESGKTTLVSQLLQDPKIALEAGMEKEAETRDVKPYRYSQNCCLIDTPGLDTPEKVIGDKFANSALRLANVYVYICSYTGLPRAADINFVKSVADHMSSTSNPKLLICLNNCLHRIEEDAFGEPVMTISDAKENWRSEMVRVLREQSTPRQLVNSIRVELVELKGDSLYEDKHGVWTAHSVNNWIAKGLDISECKPFNYPEWQYGGLELKRQRKLEQQRAKDEREAALDAIMDH